MMTELSLLDADEDEKVAKGFAKAFRKACKQVVSRKGAAADN